MSMEVFESLLKKMRIIMEQREKEELYRKVKRDFALIGSNECEDLERRLRDPYEREQIENYILEILRLKKVDEEEKRKEKMEIYA